MDRLIVYLIIISLLLTGCHTSQTAIATYIDNSIPPDIIKSDHEPIHVLVLSSSKEGKAGSTLHHLQQSLVVNMLLSTNTIQDFAGSNEHYDLIYLDPYVTGEEIKAIREQIIANTERGGTLFLSQEQAKYFPPDFTGINEFIPINDKEINFTYPEIRQNLRGIQGVWNVFADIYGRYQGLNPEYHIDFKEGAMVGTALAMVTKGELALLTANQFGNGTVIWANNFLPNEQFITRFDLVSENNQKYFHFGYASANYLFRNELVKYVAKEKNGFSIQKTYGPYGRPGLAWQAHYEALYSFVLRDMIKWNELLEKHNQIPTYSLVRGSYNGGQWHEALRYFENIGTNSEPYFINLEDDSFYSGGQALTTKEDIIRFARYPGYVTLLAPVELPYRAYVSVTDWNQDGFPDSVIGSYDGKVYLLLNEGETASLVFDKPVILAGVQVEAAATPTIVDWNGDGYQDLVVRNEKGELYLFINKGDNSFVNQGKLRVNNKPIKTSGASAPRAVDWDGDGILDLLVGDQEGRIHFFKGQQVGALELDTGFLLQDTEGIIQVGGFAAPTAIDWNEDGYLDLLIGDATGEITLFLGDSVGALINQGKLTGEHPNYFGTNNINVGHFAVPVVFDFNHDGKKDLLTGHLEYGSPYAIDNPLFPYSKELKENIAHSLSRKIPIIPHMYLNRYLTPERELQEMKLHKAAFKKLGLTWDDDMGVNHHTWSINKDAVQTFMNQQKVGIWWNFGFNPPNVSTAPRDGKEFLMVIPFMLATDNQDRKFEEFMLFSPAPNCLNFSLAWHGLAKYDIPLTNFEHIEHSMKPGTEVYRKLINEINFLNDFRKQFEYTFQTEEQMARAMLNTFYATIKIDTTPQGLLLTPDYTGVPKNVKEYENTLGVKIELGEKYADKVINTSSMFYYEGNGGYYIGVDVPVTVDFVDESKMSDRIYFTRSNGPVEIVSTEGNVLKLRLNTTGMQELGIYSPIKLQVKGNNLKVDRSGNHYTVIHFGDATEISLIAK